MTFASIGILVTAAYSLRTIGKMFMGPFNPRWEGLQDLTPREYVATAPLILLMVGLGLFPSFALNLMNATLKQMVVIFK